MKRIRLAFLILGVLLLIPFVWVMREASLTVARERELRHQSIAERIFDEMERELTVFLSTRELNPPELALVRSPEAGERLLEPEFVLDYFVIESSEIASSTQVVHSFQRALIVVDASDQESSLPPTSIPNTGKTLKQAPGTTIALKKNQEPNRPSRPDEEPGTDSESRLADSKNSDEFQAQQSPEQALADAYRSENVLRQLNRGSIERKLRNSPDSLPSQSKSEMDSTAQRATDTFEETSASSLVVSSYEPFRAVSLESDRLLLVRSESETLRPADGYVLRVSGLVQWLGERVLGSADLTPYASVSLTELSDNAGSLGGDDGLLYSHRFEAPFGDVTSYLTLAPLPDAAGERYLPLLSLLVVFGLVSGLFALYRMVSVSLEFAERQQNFVSAVTHELKTPLTAIRLYGEMLRDDLAPNEEKRRHYFNVISKESERLTRLVNNVLELSKLQRRRGEANQVDLRAGRIGPILEDVLEILEPHATEHGFSIELDLPERLPAVLVDRDALQQVFFNVIDNAIKYGEAAPTKEILIHARREKNRLELSIADRGPGVSDKHLRRLFEPFYRSESELTRRTQGTGIGLALVRGLVSSMGGEVWGRNRAGGGFEVFLTLPLAENP